MDKLILWILFALISGIVEGVFFSNRNYDKGFKIDPHGPLLVTRTIVAIGFALPLEVGFLRLFLTFAFIFPFFHDGMYYLIRSKITKDVPEYNWFSMSSESTAFLEIGPVFRVLFAFFGFLIFFINK